MNARRPTFTRCGPTHRTLYRIPTGTTHVLAMTRGEAKPVVARRTGCGKEFSWTKPRRHGVCIGAGSWRIRSPAVGLKPRPTAAGPPLKEVARPPGSPLPRARGNRALSIVPLSHRSPPRSVPVASDRVAVRGIRRWSCRPLAPFALRSLYRHIADRRIAVHRRASEGSGVRGGAAITSRTRRHLAGEKWNPPS